MAETTSTLSDIQTTSLLTAGLRALETLRAPGHERVLEDELAVTLAGDTGTEMARDFMAVYAQAYHALAVQPHAANFVAARSSYFDKELLEYLQHHPSCSQVVIVGSGMDTRAYRLGLAPNAHVFEIDFAGIHEYKASRLSHSASPTATLHSIAADMSAPSLWPAALLAAGFDREKTSIWIAEGLVYYLPLTSIPSFVHEVALLSSAASCFLFDAWEDLNVMGQGFPSVIKWFKEHGITFTSSSKTVLEALEQECCKVLAKDETPEGLTRFVSGKAVANTPKE